MKLKHQLPEIYKHLLPPELLEEEMVEKKATCKSCAMAPQKRPAGSRITYEPNLKCCTFEPFMPNYLVGAILLEDKRFPVGAASIRRKIALREYALPMGLVPTIRFQVEFNQRKTGDFGNREDWLCPYFDRAHNNCGIWKYRGSVCTTFYCQSDFGRSGFRFWRNLSELLNATEMALSEEALVELDFSPRQVSNQLDYFNRHQGTKTEIASASIPQRKWLEIWNGYDNEIEAFYKKTAGLVQSWDRNRFEEAMGEWGQRFERKTLAQKRRLK